MSISELLSAKLPAEVVRTRDGMSYVEGWYVIDEANKCFGFDGWAMETLETRQVQEHACKLKSGKDGWRVGYTCRVRVSVLGIVRDGMGAGNGIDQDLFKAHESAIKEAETDAMKRAFRTFGYRFGLALYDKKQEHVDSAGKGAKMSSKTSAIDDKALKAWKALKLDDRDFDSFVASQGKTLAYRIIARAHQEGVSLDDAAKAVASV